GLAAAVDRAIAEGGSIGQFRDDFDALVERHGWSYTGGRDWRTRVIYTTNMATSYGAGRVAIPQRSRCGASARHLRCNPRGSSDCPDPSPPSTSEAFPGYEPGGTMPEPERGKAST